MKKVIIAIVVIALIAAAGTGVYFLFFNKDDAPDQESLLSVTYDDFIDSTGLLEALMKNPDRYQAALATEYEMGEEKAAEFYTAPEEWLAYEQIINIKNIGEDNYTITGFKVKDNGKDGVYICTKTGGDLGIAPGGTATTSFSILCSDGELSTEEVKKIANSIDVEVVFTKTPQEYDDGTESVEETKTAAIIKNAA